jgi:hypothetical protein
MQDRSQAAEGVRALLGVALLAAVPAAPGAQPPVLSFEGYGAVRFGMSVPEARQAAGGKAHDLASQECHYATFSGYTHARFMVEAGRITRVETDKAAVNALGLSVGMALAQVRRRYPDVRITAHKYDEHGHYLFFASPSGTTAIVAEESGGRVTRVRAGLLPAVEYVEGCG